MADDQGTPPQLPLGDSGDGNRNNIQINIEDEMKRSYLDYAMSVIVARALPDVRDGLKPVHRRILYSMQVNGNLWNRGYRKTARIVGDDHVLAGNERQGAICQAQKAEHWQLGRFEA